MRLLRDKDYLTQIQPTELLQIIQNDEYEYMLVAEQAAQSQMISYLVQRYDTSNIFTDTTEFDINVVYHGKNLVEYTAPIYESGTTYSTDDRVVYESKIYASVSGSTSVLPSTGSTSWIYITPDKTLYYAKLNANEFSYTTTYNAGDIVWYKNVNYQALTTTIGYAPTADTLRFSAGTTYSFTGFYPENTTYWIKGDNRNAQIVMYLVDIALYILHSRVSGRNVPELRQIRYDGGGANGYETGGAIGWLKKVASGDVTADLPNIVPQQGMSIRYGINEIRFRNTY